MKFYQHSQFCASRDFTETHWNMELQDLWWAVGILALLVKMLPVCHPPVQVWQRKCMPCAYSQSRHRRAQPLKACDFTLMVNWQGRIWNNCWPFVKTKFLTITRYTHRERARESAIGPLNIKMWKCRWIPSPLKLSYCTSLPSWGLEKCAFIIHWCRNMFEKNCSKC